MTTVLINNQSSFIYLSSYNRRLIIYFYFLISHFEILIFDNYDSTDSWCSLPMFEGLLSLILTACLHTLLSSITHLFTIIRPLILDGFLKNEFEWVKLGEAIWISAT